MHQEGATPLGALNDLPDSDFHMFAESLFSFLKDSTFDLSAQVKLLQHAQVVQRKRLDQDALQLLQQCLRDRYNPTRVHHCLRTAGLSDARSKEISRLWDRDLSAMSKQLLRGTLTTHELVDFEWKLAVTVATDEVQDAGATLVQLRLTVREGQDSSLDRKTVMFEMTIPEFYNMYGLLKQAQAQCKLLGV